MAPRLVRASALAALGVSGALFLGACTSASNDATGSTSVSVPSHSTTSGVTAAPEPYTGTDPSAVSGPASEESGSTTDTTTAPPPATTAVPQPGGPGNITDPVAEGTVVSAAPVALDATSDSGTGVAVALSSIESISTEAELPGEVAGPGVKVTVSIANSSAETVDLGNVVVDLQDAAGTPAIPMTVEASPLTNSLAPGTTATGVYVFSVPATYTNPATITVTYSPGSPVAVFTGDAR